MPPGHFSLARCYFLPPNAHLNRRLYAMYARCGELARRMPERKNAFRISCRSKSHSIRLSSALTRS